MELTNMLKNEDYFEGDAPSIHVIIREVKFEGGQTESIPAISFEISGISLEGQVAVKGSRDQILQVLGPEVAIKLMDRVSISPKRRKSVSEMDGLPDHHKLHEDAAAGRSKLPGMEHARERPKSSDNLLHGSGSWDGENEKKNLVVTALFQIRKDGEKNGVVTTVTGLSAEIRSHPVDLMHCPQIVKAIEHAVSSLLDQGLKAGSSRP
eukprot:CAMPEP_0178412284 /NCGR_PEP_ID=MMETSP0689_2-20121128/21938_1 /TAXON_ID=160604 /ORGANISM="Amphidinium massartii, Strain CS-259" /LENGTH=207 /DNA_ID=CAMNT_0020033531 /DNA_START=175 /DNA_END=798 /DNA_ORIENTATION=-